MGAFPNPFTTTRNRGCIFPGEPYRKGIVGDGGLLFFPVFVLDDDGLVRTGKSGGKTRAILLYPFMDEVPVSLQANDESLFLFSRNLS